MQSLENLFYFQLRKLSVKKLLGSSLFRLYDTKEVLFLKWNERHLIAYFGMLMAQL